MPGIQAGAGTDDHFGLATGSREQRLGLISELGSQLIHGGGAVSLQADIAVGAEGDVAGGTRTTGGRGDLGIAAELDRRCLERDIPSVLACSATGLQACLVLQLDAVGGRDLHIATAVIGHQRCQLTADLHTIAADDPDRAIGLGHAGADRNTLQVDGVDEHRLGGTGASLQRGARGDDGRSTKQVDRTGGVDLAVDLQRARAVVELAGYQLGGNPVGICTAAAAGHIGQLSHLRRTRRRHRQATDVHHTAGTDHHAMGVGEDDVAADLAVFQAVEGAIDLGACVVHKVDQGAGTCGHMQIHRITRINGESAELVESRTATHRCRGDVGDAIGRRTDSGATPAGHGGDVVGLRPARQGAEGGQQSGGDRIRLEAYARLFLDCAQGRRSTLDRHVGASLDTGLTRMQDSPGTFPKPVGMRHSMM